MEDLKRVVSAPFKKNLAVSLSEKDFEFSLAFDLKWFSPRAASKVKALALETGLLLKKENQLSPGFDVESVRLPHSFKPAEDFLQGLEGMAASKSSDAKSPDAKSPDAKSSDAKSSESQNTVNSSKYSGDLGFEQVLEFIAANTRLNKQTLASEINSMQDRLSYLVDIRVVALIVARKFGCDIESIFEKVAGAVLGLPDFT